MQERIEKLEILFMQQEQALEALSTQVYLQQQDIRHLLLQVEQLTERLKTMSASLIATSAEETPPPHY